MQTNPASQKNTVAIIPTAIQIMTVNRSLFCSVTFSPPLVVCMKKHLVSIILAAFLILSMMPFSAFADGIVCPACGGAVTKQERRLVSAHDDFYKCDKCGKWAWVNKLGSLSLLSVGDQQILDAADASALINFSFNNGHLIPAKQAPSGIGRKDLPGYADDNGTPTYNSNGELQVTVYPRFSFTSSAYLQDYPTSIRSNHNNATWTIDGLKVTGRSTSSGHTDACNVYFDYFLSAPISGTYYIATKQEYLRNRYVLSSRQFVNSSFSAGSYSFYLSAGGTKSFSSQNLVFYCDNMGLANSTVISYFFPIVLTVVPDTTTINKQTNITINNNTWNGNIYVDNSNNLTYIYPEYTTINENNETVTNISNNPIIYNNETQQYYTYDSTTNNYYYITYETTPTPTPTPTPSPGTDPTPTPTPGGGSGGGDGGNGGSGSGSSGSSWWEKLLDKLGSTIVDGLLGAISAVLKLIFKLFSTILGWIIWLTSQVLTLFPFLPPGLGALLIGGVVVCFVIGIIKFIRG